MANVNQASLKSPNLPLQFETNQEVCLDSPISQRTSSSLSAVAKSRGGAREWRSPQWSCRTCSTSNRRLSCPQVPVPGILCLKRKSNTDLVRQDKTHRVFAYLLETLKGRLTASFTDAKGPVVHREDFQDVKWYLVSLHTTWRVHDKMLLGCFLSVCLCMCALPTCINHLWAATVPCLCYSNPKNHTCGDPFRRHFGHHA